MVRIASGSTVESLTGRGRYVTLEAGAVASEEVIVKPGDIILGHDGCSDLFDESVWLTSWHRKHDSVGGQGLARQLSGPGERKEHLYQASESFSSLLVSSDIICSCCLDRAMTDFGNSLGHTVLLRVTVLPSATSSRAELQNSPISI